PAGFWIRFVAYMIDGLILGAAALMMLGAAGTVVAISLGLEDIDDLDIYDLDDNPGPILIGVFLAAIVFIIMSWLYEALMTSSRLGATLGKRALGLRIIRADGAPLSFGRATARHFLKVMITPMVPLAIGYLLAAFTKGKRALHDFMADTLVVQVS